MSLWANSKFFPELTGELYGWLLATLVFLQHYSRFPLQTHTHPLFFVGSLLQAHCYHLVNNRSALSMIFHYIPFCFWKAGIVGVFGMGGQRRCELRHTVLPFILKTPYFGPLTTPRQRGLVTRLCSLTTHTCKAHKHTLCSPPGPAAGPPPTVAWPGAARLSAPGELRHGYRMHLAVTLL